MNSTKKRKSIHKEGSISEELNFCTECNEDLNNFDIDPVIKGKVDVLANHENCKKTGKFKGDKCSKLFIEEADNITHISEEDEF